MKTKSVFFKSICWTLILSFSYSQFCYALTPRELLDQAKASFGLMGDDHHQGGGSNPVDLQQSQVQAQSAVDQQNNLQDLQNLNFSLTTQNGDTLNYVNNTLSQITRPDGTTLNNISQDAMTGNITGANLRLNDGTIQILQNGNILGSQTPDGTQVFYDLQTGKVQRTVSSSGEETTYTYINSETILESAHFQTAYDANDKIKHILDKQTHKESFFNNGILQRIEEVDHSQYLFGHETTGTDIRVSLEAFIDSIGNRFDFTGDDVSRVTLVDGTELQNTVWNSQDQTLRDFSFTEASGNTRTVLNNQTSQIDLSNNGGSITDITWNPQTHALENYHFTNPAGDDFTVVNGLASQIHLASNQGSISNSILDPSTGLLRDYVFTDPAGNVFTALNNQATQIDLYNHQGEISNITWNPTNHTLEDYVFTDPNGNEFTVAQTQVSQIFLPSGQGRLTNITWNSLDQTLKNYTFTDFDGNVFTVVDNQTTRIVLSGNRGELAGIEWDAVTHSLKNYTHTDSAGNIFTVQNNQTIQIDLANSAGRITNIVWNPQTLALESYHFTNSSGDEFAVNNGQTTEILLANNDGRLTNIIWDSQTYALSNYMLTDLAGNQFTVAQNQTTQIALSNNAGVITNILWDNATHLLKDYVFTDSTGNVSTVQNNQTVQINIPTQGNLTNIVWSSTTQSLADFIFTDLSGNAFTVQNNQTTHIALSNSRGTLTNTGWDSATGVLKDYLFTNPSGDIFTVINDQTSDVLLANNAGRLTNIIFDPQSHLTKDYVLTDSAGNIFTVVNNQATEIDLAHNAGRITGIIWNSQNTIDQALLTDSQNRQIQYQGGVATRITLPSGEVISNITWNSNGTVHEAALADSQNNQYFFRDNVIIKVQDSNGVLFENILWGQDQKIKDASVTFPDGRTTLYQDKKLIRLTDAQGVITNFTYTPDRILASSNGINSEYLLDGTLVKTTDAQGNQTLYFAQGPQKGLKEKDVTVAGDTFIYEYSQNNTLIQRRQVLRSEQTVTTIEGQTTLQAKNNPFFGFEASFQNPELDSQEVRLITNGSYPLEIKLKPGQDAAFSFNRGAFQSLGVRIEQGFAYKVEIQISKTGIQIFIYKSTDPRPSNPARTIQRSNWNTRFEIISTNAQVRLDARSAGTYRTDTTTQDRQNAYRSGSPVEQLTFRLTPQNSYSRPSIQLTAEQQNTSRQKRTFYLDYQNNQWRITAFGGGISFQSFAINQTLQSNVDYAAELRFENNQLKFYVYPKGQQRPQSPLATLNALTNASARFNSDFNNAQGQAQVLYNLTSPTLSSARASSLPQNMDLLQNSNLLSQTLPSAPMSLSYQNPGFSFAESQLALQRPDFRMTQVSFAFTEPNIHETEFSPSLAGPTFVFNEPVFSFSRPNLNLTQTNVSSMVNPSISLIQNDLNLITDQTISIVRPLKFDLDNAIGFSSTTYNLHGGLEEVLKADSSRYVFEDGVLSQAFNAQGQATNFSFQESGLSNVVGATISQNQVQSHYSAEGELESVVVGDMTVHYGSNQSIDYLEKSDGTEIHDITFDANGQIQNASVYLPDGRIKFYENGHLVRSQEADHSQLFFVNDQAVQMITAQNLTYDFNYTPGHIEAVLNTANIPIPDALTPVRMQHDSNFNLQQIVRQNNEIINFTNNQVQSVQTPSQSPQTIVQLADGYKVLQDNTETFYDSNNQIQKVLIHTTASNSHELEVSYQYGKIRQIKKDNTLTFTYSYEFTSENKERTVIHDLEENSTKTYENELLLTSFDNDTSVLSNYSYDANKKVSRVVVSRLGRTLHTYNYTYSNDQTLVTDEEGILRTYDSNNKLIFLDKENKRFTYTYHTDATTHEEIIEEKLIRQTLEGGAVVDYDVDGQIQKIQNTDGTFIDHVVLGGQRNIQKATIHLLDGTSKVFSGTQILEEITPQNTHFYFDEGRITRVVGSQGDEFDYIYDQDSGGNVVRVRSDIGQAYLEYDINGDLQGFRPKDSNQFYHLTKTFDASGRPTYFLNAYGASFQFQESGLQLSINQFSFLQSQPDNRTTIFTLPQIDHAVPFFGTGVDGDARVTAATYLTRDMNYNSLTIDSGAILYPNGHKIFVNGDLINNGSISVDGQGGQGGGGGAPRPTGSPSGGQSGQSQTDSFGGIGGNGGAGGDTRYTSPRGASSFYPGYPGGSGGAISGFASTTLPTDILAGNPVNISAGAGGGGGGSSAMVYGGSGGPGGGALFIFAKNIKNENGTISANGQNGVDGGWGPGIGDGGSGGGGGGGGGTIYLVYQAIENGNIQTNPGLGGSGGGGSSQGGAGASGLPGSVVKFSPLNLNISFDSSELRLPYFDKMNFDKGFSDATNQIYTGTYAFGQISQIQGIYNSQGVNIDVQKNLIHQITESSGQRKDYSYQRDINGALTGITVTQNNTQMHYSPDGVLNGVRFLSMPNTIDQAKDFVDASSGNFTIASTGNVALDVDQQGFFGNASALFDGASSYLSVNPNPAFNFGTGDFTMETRLFLQSLPANNSEAVIFDNGGVQGVRLGISNTNGLYQIHLVIANTNYSLNFVPQANSWQHLALVRNSGVIKIFVDGYQVGSDIQNASNISNLSQGLRIGNSFSGNQFFKGSLDELRISKGVVRYAQNFTSNTESHRSDSFTSLLLHFDGTDYSNFSIRKDGANFIFEGASGQTFLIPASVGMTDSVTINPSFITQSRDAVQRVNFSINPLEQNPSQRFGDGHDGSATLLSNTTLTRDMYYDNLTINPGATLNPNGYKIFVKGMLTNNGTISVQGGNGSNGQGAYKPGDGDTNPGSGGGAGQPVTTQIKSLGSSVAGGSGGSGGHGGGGGAGQNGQSVAQSLGGPGGGNGGSVQNYSIQALNPDVFSNQTILTLQGGASGQGGAGGGGQNYTGSGGGGGGGAAGGGVIAIYAQQILNQNGIITANGGNGGTGGGGQGEEYYNGRGDGGSGGSGGGGGTIFLVYDQIQDGTITSSGGQGGNGVGGSRGATGANGQPGQTGTILRYDTASLNPITLALELPFKAINTALSRANETLQGWMSSVTQANLSSQDVVSQEYSASGILEDQVHADGTVTIFENNKPSMVLDKEGLVLIQYTYDSEGHPTRVYLKNARNALPDEIAKARQKIEDQRANDLRNLAIQKNLSYQSIQTQAAAQRAQLESQLSQVEDQLSHISGIEVKGKAQRVQKANALEQLGDAVSQINQALTDLSLQEGSAYANLDSQVLFLSNKIEADTQTAITNLRIQEDQLKIEILRQEVSPIVYDNYRRILGRDPSSSEYNFWIGQIDYATGESLQEVKTLQGINLTTALNAHLLALPELAQRQAYVNSIKQSVTSEIDQYLNLSAEDKLLFLQSLGLSASDAINLTNSDAQKVLSWLNTRSLHFGQSAFLSLEALLDQNHIAFQREDIARKAILIDVLCGIISPLDDGDLVISLFALNKVAGLYGLSLSGANLNWNDLQSIYNSNPSSKIIAHINSVHYVIITNVTENSVTYIDPSIGKDKENESLTVTKEGFLKLWQGNVTLETQTLNTLPNAQSKVLSAEATQGIRGAFWGSLLNLIGFVVWIINPELGFLLNMIRLAALGASIAEGDWLSGLSSIVSLNFGDLGNAFGTIFKGASTGVTQTISSLGQALNGVGQFFGTIFQSVTGFFGNISQGLNSFLQGSLGISSGIGQRIVETAVGVGINYGVSKGLTAIGVDEQVSGFLGSLTAGAIIGGMKDETIAGGHVAVTHAQNIQASVQQVLTISNVGQLGAELHLDPTLTSIVGLSLGAIQGHIITNPGSNLEYAFSEIRPNLYSSLAQYGVSELAQSFGVDSNLAPIFTLPVASGLNALTTGQDVIQAVNQGLNQGIVRYGLNFAGNSNPIFGSLLSPDIQNSIEQSVGQQGLFQGIFSIVGRTTRGLLQGVSAIGQSIQSFGSLVQQRGLAGALSQTMSSFFGRSSIEQIVNQGGIAQSLQNAPRQQVTLNNGQTATEVELSQDASIYLDSQGDLLGTRDQDLVQIGDFGYDTNADIFLSDGMVYSDLPDQYQLSMQVDGYQPIHIEVSDNQNQPVLQVTPKDGQQNIQIQSPTQTSPSFLNSILSLVPMGLSFLMSEGVAEAAGISVNTASANPIGQLIDVVLLNGVRLTEFAREGEAPRYFQSGNAFRNELNRLHVSDNSIKTISLFEQFGTDLYQWLQNQKLAQEVTNELVQIRNTQLNHPFVPLAYSGGGRPLLNALANETHNGFGVQTAILVGSPMTEAETLIESPTLSTIVNIYGSNDLFLVATPQDGVPSISKHFSSDDHYVQTINIELQGIGHTDYFYSSNETPSALKMKACNFIARLTQAALDEQTLGDFLNLLGAPYSAETFDDEHYLSEVKNYVINLNNLPDLNL